MVKRKTEIILQVFVGSPSDVKDERIILEEVIQELNNNWKNLYNLRLELLKWETDASPGMGENPQDVINEEIPNTYDIFIGIFWTRLGTPTNRAKSGTIEEFNRAYEQYQKDSNSIEIMLYFKETPIKFSTVDIEQIKEVKNFKSEISGKSLYFKFDTTDSFVKLIRSHLNKKINKWIQRDLNNEKSLDFEQINHSDKSPPNSISIEEEDFLKRIEHSLPLVERGYFNIININRVVEDFHKFLHKRNPYNKSSKKIFEISLDNNDTSKSTYYVSSFIKDFTKRIDLEIELFKKSIELAFEPYDDFSVQSSEFINENSTIIKIALNVVNDLKMNVVESNPMLKNIKKLLKRLQIVEIDIERACYKAIESIDLLLQHKEIVRRESAKVEDYLSALI